MHQGEACVRLTSTTYCVFACINEDSINQDLAAATAKLESMSLGIMGRREMLTKAKGEAFKPLGNTQCRRQAQIFIGPQVHAFPWRSGCRSP